MRRSAIALFVSAVALVVVLCVPQNEKVKAPPEPAALSFTSNSPNSATICWKPGADSSAIVKYVLYYSDHSGVDTLDTVARVATGAERCIDLCALLPATTGFYRVFSQDQHGLATGSNEITVTTAAVAAPHFTLSSIAASNPLDNDQDGFASSYTLTYHISNAANEAGSVYARLYYRPLDSLVWKLFRIDTVALTSSITDSAVSHVIGADLQESVMLKAALYNQSQVLIASMVSQTPIKEETNAADGVVKVQYFVHSLVKDSVDLDRDGYLSSYAISSDVDVSQGSAAVEIRLYYKAAGDADWKLFSRDTVTVTGVSAADRVSQVIGAEGHRTVAIKTMVFDMAGHALAADSIAGINEESRTEDRVYSLTYATIDSVYDGDQDGYYSAIRLRFGADISGGSDSVYAIVKRRIAQQDSVLYQSPLFLVSATAPSTQHPERIVLLGTGSGSSDSIILEVHKTDNSLIGTAAFSVKEELPSNDVPVLFTSSLTRTTAVDADGDGFYANNWTMTYRATVNSGTHSVIAHLYYRVSGASTWSPLSNSSGVSSVTLSVSPAAAGSTTLSDPYYTGSGRTIDIMVTITQSGSVVSTAYYYGLKEEYFVYD
jgi:hypothetical protein